MPYWRLFYHLVWATKSRLPLLDESVEPQIHRSLSAKCHDLDIIIYAINGMPDHVHLIAAVPPRISISDFIGQVKGASSHFANHELQIDFGWQEGFGAFSISPRGLEKAVDYVRRQKEHHQQGTIIEALERFMREDDGPSPS